MKHIWAPWRLAYLQGDNQKLDGCVFCNKLKADDAIEHILYRGTYSYITLNRYPYSNGHLMIVPYQHTGSLEELSDGTLIETMQLLKHTLRILREIYHPQGFNFGLNEGSAGGAGIAEHVHFHIVPRWEGDANYMTVIGETRIIPQTLDDTYSDLKPEFNNLTGGLTL